MRPLPTAWPIEALAHFVAHLMNEEVTPTLTVPPGADIAAYKAGPAAPLPQSGPAPPHLADRHGRLAETAAAPARHHPRPAEGGSVHRRPGLGVAAWMRYVTGIDEKGAADRRARSLARRTARQSRCGRPRCAASSPPALLAVEQIFGRDLPANPHFTTAVTAALDSLFRKRQPQATYQAFPEHTSMKQTWRWFGPDDPVTLAHVRQAGAVGIVSALHHMNRGQAWTDDEMLKAQGDDREGRPHLGRGREHRRARSDQDAHRQTSARRSTITRPRSAPWPRPASRCAATISWPSPTGRAPTSTGRCPMAARRCASTSIDFCAYDVLVLKRRDAEADHPPERIAAAKKRLASWPESKRRRDRAQPDRLGAGARDGL